MREYVRPDLADAVRRIKLRMQAEHARTIRELDQLLCDHDWRPDGGTAHVCARCGERNYEASQQHHNGHYGVPCALGRGVAPVDYCPCVACVLARPAGPVCVCLHPTGGRAFCPIHAADENPCGKGCSDPRAHAEGAHDV